MATRSEMSEPGMEDTRELLHIVLQWMATDRLEKRVEREERRSRFHQLSTRLDRLEGLISDQQRKLEEVCQQVNVSQAAVQDDLKELRRDITPPKVALQQPPNLIQSRDQGSTPLAECFDQTNTEEFGHTMRLNHLRELVADNSAIDNISTNTRNITNPFLCQEDIRVHFPEVPTMGESSTRRASSLTIDAAPGTPNVQRSSVVQLMQFDGKMSWENYITHLQTVADANSWDNETARIHLAASLRDRALEYFQVLDVDTQRSYQKLVTSLKRRFGTRLTTSAAQTKFQTRHQQRTETLEEFATDIKRLGRVAHPSYPINVMSELCLTQFLNGIDDTELQCGVRDRDPRDLEEALLIAEKLESNRTTARAMKRMSVREATILEPVRNSNAASSSSGNEHESA